MCTWVSFSLNTVRTILIIFYFQRLSLLQFSAAFNFLFGDSCVLETIHDTPLQQITYSYPP